MLAACWNPIAQSPLGIPGCARVFRVGFVTDLAKLAKGSPNAEAWQGAQDAASDPSRCVRAALLQSNDPADYALGIQKFVDQRYDMVIASSFLLTEETLAAARANPGTKFVLIDPLPGFEGMPNLLALTFREDQAGFLAGTVAGLMSKSGVVAGVYGLEGGAVTRYRLGFEHGARYANPAITVLGRYQTLADGVPYNNPTWGESVARAWFQQGADIVFGAGSGTGHGALAAAAQAKRICVGIDVDEFVSYPEADSCLVTSAEKHFALAVRAAIADAVDNRWPTSGRLSFDATNAGIGIAPYHNYDVLISSAVKAKIVATMSKLADGSLNTGVTL